MPHQGEPQEEPEEENEMTEEQGRQKNQQALHTPLSAHIDTLEDVEEIEELQKTLSLNYKTLAKEFSKSRVARVDAYISKIEDLQQQLKRDRIAYESMVDAATPTLNPTTGAERSAAERTKQITKRKIFEPQNLDAVTSGGDSPPPMTPVLPPLGKLPIFTDCFDEILEPYRASLNSVKRKYEYTSNLIETQTDHNSGIVWRQSIKDRQDTRQSMRRDTVRKLENLKNDFYNVSKHSKVRYQELRFRASTRKSGDKKSKSDAIFIDEQVKTQVDAASRYATTDAHQMYLKGTPMTPASESEIENDLAIMRNGGPLNVRVETIEANYLYQQRPLRKFPFAPTTMTDLVNNEIEANGVAGLQFQIPQGQQQHPPGFPGPPPPHHHPHPPPPMFQQQQQQGIPQYQYQPPLPPQFQQQLYGGPPPQFQPSYRGGQMPMMPYGQMPVIPPRHQPPSHQQQPKQPGQKPQQRPQITGVSILPPSGSFRKP